MTFYQLTRNLRGLQALGRFYETKKVAIDLFAMETHTILTNFYSGLPWTMVISHGQYCPRSNKPQFFDMRTFQHGQLRSLGGFE